MDNPYEYPRRLGKRLALYDIYRKASGVSGCVVECGVFRGASLFCLATFSTLLNDGRTVYGVDTYTSFPYTGDASDDEFIDSFTGSHGQPHSACQIVRDMHERDLTCVRVIESDVASFVSTYSLGPIAVLHIDVDTYSATREALKLYDMVSPGGVIVLDDYRAVEGATRAIEEFARERSIVIHGNPFFITPHFIEV